ncbi:hypothetical protein DPV78_011135 [Talaromyces pinophilus]|nr:hypothetical protein DPV78_011135 [Talaromyces pinophilus]
MDRKNYVEKIAIVGAGGRIGKHITNSLLATGKHTITALTRPGSNPILPSDVTVLKVGYNNNDSLVRALRGQDVLIIILNISVPPETQHNLITAAAGAGVRWILPNEFGGDPFDPRKGEDTLIGAGKAQFREHIQRLGCNYVGIACGFWYEFSIGGGPNRFGFDFEEKRVIMMDGGGTRISTSTMPMVGRAVAALLSLRISRDDYDHDQDQDQDGDKGSGGGGGGGGASLEDFKNKAVYISSFTLSQQDMLQSILRVTGTRPEDWTITHTTAKQRWQSGQEMLKDGNMAGLVRLTYARAFFPDDPEDFEASKGLDNEVLGLVQEDLDEFTRTGMDTNLTHVK